MMTAKIEEFDCYAIPLKRRIVEDVLGGLAFDLGVKIPLTVEFDNGRITLDYNEKYDKFEFDKEINNIEKVVYAFIEAIRKNTVREIKRYKWEDIVIIEVKKSN